ncbi:WHG domain-containing protein [Herbiconiux sp. CPCC 205763]|uniref:WHG domain-containing protein n=1 Tax=Herbiconiux aconitum TaxID=2970913 RepID=A0ABT2GSA5_9MICO|nr:TetR/AcrR family transcriptional regulator [Herbiconiux aconitum]MCS5717706.1 WHG domain-containing protein [Herbiconiux aconitum]
MPAHEKTTRDAIVAAGRELLETLGIDGLTMQAVAERVGVRAPSLYKRVRDRRELLALIVAASLDDLTGRLEATRTEADPRRRLIAQADALRRFAHARPVGYGLLFGAHGAPQPEPSMIGASVAPLLDAVSELVGPDHALDGARLVTAWATGFLAMELADRLRLGGDVDVAWQWGLQRIVDALG